MYHIEYNNPSTTTDTTKLIPSMTTKQPTNQPTLFKTLKCCAKTVNKYLVQIFDFLEFILANDE